MLSRQGFSPPAVQITDGYITDQDRRFPWRSKLLATRYAPLPVEFPMPEQAYPGLAQGPPPDSPASVAYSRIPVPTQTVALPELSVPVHCQNPPPTALTGSWFALVRQEIQYRLSTHLTLPIRHYADNSAKH